MKTLMNRFCLVAVLFSVCAAICSAMTPYSVLLAVTSQQKAQLSPEERWNSVNHVDAMEKADFDQVVTGDFIKSTPESLTSVMAVPAPSKMFKERLEGEKPNWYLMLLLPKDFRIDDMLKTSDGYVEVSVTTENIVRGKIILGTAEKNSSRQLYIPMQLNLADPNAIGQTVSVRFYTEEKGYRFSATVQK